MYIAIIVFISAVTHFFHFGFPAQVVFDEVYFGNFVSKYLSHSFFFDQHPPLAKLILALTGYIFGVGNYSIDWGSIGNPIPEAAVLVRLLPTLAGALLPIVIYLLCRRLDVSKPSAFVVSLFLALDGSLLVQSRYILTDSMLLLAGFASVLCYLEWGRRKLLWQRYSLLAASAVLSAAAISIKWTALTFPFIIILFEIYRLYESKQKPKLFLKKFCLFIIPYIVSAAVIYVSVFAIHFSVLANSGSGDPFMSPSFLKTLSGSAYADDPSVTPSNFIAKFLELNNVMFATNEGMVATHPYSSKWYTWPFMARPIFYWQGPDMSGGMRSYIYLFGNPVVYWLGALAMLYFLLSVFCSLFHRHPLAPDRTKRRLFLFILVGYLANFLPFIAIGRVMFLYHYEVALVFSVIAIGYLLDLMPSKKQNIAVSILLVLAAAAFFYWAPLIYGTPLSDAGLAHHIWFASWR